MNDRSLFFRHPYMSVEKHKVGLIADEDTILAFLLCGLEENKENPNFMTVTNETPEEDLCKHFKELTARDDIALVFINDFVEKKIKEIMDVYSKKIPHVMVIPSKLGVNGD